MHFCNLLSRKGWIGLQERTYLRRIGKVSDDTSAQVVYFFLFNYWWQMRTRQQLYSKVSLFDLEKHRYTCISKSSSCYSAKVVTFHFRNLDSHTNENEYWFTETFKNRYKQMSIICFLEISFIITQLSQVCILTRKTINYKLLICSIMHKRYISHYAYRVIFEIKGFVENILLAQIQLVTMRPMQYFCVGSSFILHHFDLPYFFVNS